jgi:hypothetical protein
LFSFIPRPAFLDSHTVHRCPVSASAHITIAAFYPEKGTAVEIFAVFSDLLESFRDYCVFLRKPLIGDVTPVYIESENAIAILQRHFAEEGAVTSLKILTAHFPSVAYG